MAERERYYKGRWYPDPGGFSILPKRAWREDPLLQGRVLTQWEAWQWVCAHAVWERGGRIVKRDEHTLKLARGQMCHSLRFLATAWSPGVTDPRKRLSHTTVKRWLKKWAKDEFGVGPRITLQALLPGHLITVVNMDPYQDPEFYRVTPDNTRALQGRYKAATNRNNSEPGTESVEKQSHAHTTENPETTMDHHDATWADIRRAIQAEIWASVPKTARLQMVASAWGADPRWPPDLTDDVRSERHILDPQSERAELDDLKHRLARLAKGETP